MLQFWTRRGWVLALGLLLLAAVVPPGVGLAGTDPEPTVETYPASNYDPGPGWPAGWTPPAAPTSISDTVRKDWESIKSSMTPPVPENLVLRVLNPLPAWTQEYVYTWRFDYVICGNTAYAYYFPTPDVLLYRQTTPLHDTISVGRMPAGGCQLGPVRTIRHNREQTPEELEQWRLVDKLSEDAWASRGGRTSDGGLDGCAVDLYLGTPENIIVCFNDGHASKKFDVAAYLDPTVGRVRVPVRFVSEMMGAQVTWNQATATVTILFPETTRNVVHPVSLTGYHPEDWFSPESGVPDRTETYRLEDRPVAQPRREIQLTVNKPTALVDGQPLTLDAPPVLIPPGRVMIPVRFVAQQLGAKVYWVGAEPIFKRGDRMVGRYQVHIYTPFYPFFEYPDWALEHRAMKF